MVNLIVILSFIVIGIVFIVFYKNKFVNKIENITFYSGETIIYTEYPVKCYLKRGKSTDTYLINTKVELTNYRVLISQKYLFSKKFMLNYIVNFRSNDKDIFKNYENEKFKNYMNVSPCDISFQQRKNIYYVDISVPENNLLSVMGHVTISFTTKNIEKIKAIINSKSVNRFF